MYLRRINAPALVELRADRRWSQAELALHAGVGTRTLGRIETGSHAVRPIIAARIARALGIEVDEFSELIDDRERWAA